MKYCRLVLVFFLVLLVSQTVCANAQLHDSLMVAHPFRDYFSKTELLFELRLIIALCLGMVCGVSHGYGNSSVAVSIKTFGAVALGAAAFSSVMVHAYIDTGSDRFVAGIGNIVTGIGFVCAAVIFRQESMVRGLSTAASLWTCAAIGMACGTGMFGVAFVVSLILVLFHFIPSHTKLEKVDLSKSEAD